jgi:nucleoside-diphosphate-sugar epimerase
VSPDTERLTVAITGPTGDIGRALVHTLERSRTIGEIRGMTRRPIDPEYGFERLEYRQGNVLDEGVATAIRAAIQGRGETGVYNLAGDGELTLSDLASEMGYYAVPVPELAVDATAEITARPPFMPPEAAWIQAFRVPAIMDTAKARKQLGWRPKHTGRDALRAMVAAARDERPV